MGDEISGHSKYGDNKMRSSLKEFNLKQSLHLLSCIKKELCNVPFCTKN